MLRIVEDKDRAYAYIDLLVRLMVPKELTFLVSKISTDNGSAYDPKDTVTNLCILEKTIAWQI